MAIRCVLFDMDGVVFQGPNFWLDLHQAMNTEPAGVELFDRYGDVDYDMLAQRVVGELWKGRSAKAYRELISARSYEPGIEEVISGLRDRGIKTGIITSGPLRLAQRAQRELGFDEIRGNDPIVERDRFTGKTVVGTPNSRKVEVALELLGGMGLGFDQAAYVGDSANDIEVCRKVELGIAYNSSCEELKRAVDHNLRRGELPRVLEIVDAYDPVAAH